LDWLQLPRPVLIVSVPEHTPPQNALSLERRANADGHAPFNCVGSKKINKFGVFTCKRVEEAGAFKRKRKNAPQLVE
jgi:hypothetical protein